MKKNELLEGVVEESRFPDTGILTVNGKTVAVRHALYGEKIRYRIKQVRGEKAKGELLQVLQKSPDEIPPDCPHFAACGGCAYRNLSPEKRLSLLEKQIQTLLKDKVASEAFLPIFQSPKETGYRNKMELTFGNEVKDGPLVLGLHKRNSFYDITPVSHCRIMDNDFKKIAAFTQSFFRKAKLPFYHRKTHEGCLRHLLIRKGQKTGEMLVDLVTTDWWEREDRAFRESGKALLYKWTEGLLALSLHGTWAGILHTVNTGVADVIKDEKTEILWGKDSFEETLLGLSFTVTPFSFFQTNSLGAEVLYETVRAFAGNTKEKTVFDLYSGTGTIAQIVAGVAKKVTGIEIVPEAVKAAKENAERNGLTNCVFLEGDVLKTLDALTEKPDVVILDPPRDGVHPKALQKIVDFSADTYVYISCKPTALQRDLDTFLANGYRVKQCAMVDMFPGTSHVETVVLLLRTSK